MATCHIQMLEEEGIFKNVIDYSIIDPRFLALKRNVGNAFWSEFLSCEALWKMLIIMQRHGFYRTIKEREHIVG